MLDNLNWQPLTLCNELVRLQPLLDTDFDQLFAIAADRLIWENHPAFDRYEEEVFAKFFEKAVQSKSAFLITEASNNAIVGCTRFYDYDAENNTIAIGYTFLARKYWGTPMNKNVKHLMINYAFNQGIKTVVFFVGAGNVQSQRAVLKLGAVKIKEFSKYKDGVKTDHIQYAIHQQNWLKQQK